MDLVAHHFAGRPSSNAITEKSIVYELVGEFFKMDVDAGESFMRQRLLLRLTLSAIHTNVQYSVNSTTTLMLGRTPLLLYLILQVVKSLHNK